MQIQIFPAWFQKIQELEKKNSHETMGSILSKFEFTIEIFREFITTFGIINYYRIKKLSKSINFENQYMAFNQVFEIYLQCMNESRETTPKVINQCTKLLEKNKLYDHLPTHKISQGIWSHALREMGMYILAFSMPFQEAKFRSWYSITWIKKNIDKYETNLQSKIMALFRVKSNDTIFFTQEEMLLFYKHTAIIAYNVEKSWAYILNKFFKEKDPENSFFKIWQKELLFKMFIPDLSFKSKSFSNQPSSSDSFSSKEEKSIANIKNEKEINLAPKEFFKEYLFNTTIDVLCNHKKSQLPQDGHFKERLLRLFEYSITQEKSDSNRQFIIYYIDYLHKSYEIEKSDSFLKKGLEYLDNLISDKNDVIYDFLHALIHYFHCLCETSDINLKSFLFKTILAVMYDERKKYDKQIRETYNQKPFPRERFKINETLYKFVKSHPLSNHRWGTIFLRFSQSNFSETNFLCRYINSEDHLKLVEKIECLIGPLPDELVHDLLYFQLSTNSVFGVLNQFLLIRDEIINNHLNNISIPIDLLKQLKIQSNLLLNYMSNSVSEDLIAINNRGFILSEGIYDISALLTTSTYPFSHISLNELIPKEVINQEFIFPKINVLNYIRPLHIKYDLGLTWLVRWKFIQKQKIEIIIILSNPAKNYLSCSFRLPINIPNDEQKVNQYFKLISSMIDTVEDEVCSNDKFQFTQKKEESRKFDSHTFVKLIRTSFLQSFYFVLESKRMKLFDANACINAILPCADGFYFASAISQYIDDEDDNLIAHLKNADYKEVFSKLYDTIYLYEKKIPRKHTEKLTIFFYVDQQTKNILVSLIIENLFIAETQIKIQSLIEESESNEMAKDKSPDLSKISTYESISLKKDKDFEENSKEKVPIEMVQFTIEIYINEQPYSITTYHPVFSERKEFIEFMIWQMAVVCNDHIELLID